MKMKKVVGVAVSVVLAVSMVAATAFAAETAPASPTSADKDAGKITFEATGSSSEGLNIELKTSPLSAAEEEALKAAGSVQAYLGADTYSEITRILDSNVTIHDFRMVEGPTHTNLIFDVVVPNEVKTSEAELKRRMEDILRESFPGYYFVITIDRAYVK